MQRFHVTGPDRGGGWTLVEMRTRLVGGVEPKPVRRYATKEEAEAARDAAQASWDRYLDERRRESAPWTKANADRLVAAMGPNVIDERPVLDPLGRPVRR